MTRHASIAKAALLAVLAPFAASAQEDTLVVARAMDVNSLDPSRAFCDTCQIYVSATYDTLVTLAADNESIVPSLAESWEGNEDMTGFTFRLAPDAVFSDGSPVEAKEVVWSLERVLNLKAAPSFLMEGMTGVEAVDEHTVKVTLDAPNPEFINKLSAAYIAIMNSDVASEHGAVAGEDAATADEAEAWFMENSAGSGPYVLENYAPNDEIRLAVNENYWKEKPAFATVAIDEIQDAVSQAQAPQSGGGGHRHADRPGHGGVAGGDGRGGGGDPVLQLRLRGLHSGRERDPDPGGAGGADLRHRLRGRDRVHRGGRRRAQPRPGSQRLPRREGAGAAAGEPGEGAGDAGGGRAWRRLHADRGLPEPQRLRRGHELPDAEGAAGPRARERGAGASADDLPGAAGRAGARELGMTAVYCAPDCFGTAQYPGYFAMMPGASWYNRAGGDDVEGLKSEKQIELYAQALAQIGEEKDATWNELAKEMMADNVIIPLVSPNLVLAHRAGIEGVRYSACCNLPLAEIKPAE